MSAHSVSAILWALAISCPALAQHGLTPEELAESFPPERLYEGIRIPREKCEQTKLAVWVEHKHGSECIRYYPSRNIEGTPRAVLFFHGDLLEGRFTLPGASVNNSVGAKLKEAQGLAGANGVPFVLVARPGCFGSSGEHSARRRAKEYFSMNAAVDAIKARYNIKEVILSGQSGGGATVGALLTLGRTDVVCAAASSGVFDVIGRANRWHESM